VCTGAPWLAIVDALVADGRLAGSHRPEAVRAHLCELAGDARAAERHYAPPPNAPRACPSAVTCC
jgi:predicted RNA polymerase sigma factor